MSIAVCDCPYRSDCFAMDVERNQQAFFGWRHDGQQVGISALGMSEQERSILIEHVSTWAAISVCPCTDVDAPHASDSRPIESSARSVRRFAISRQKAEASGIRLGNIENHFREGLKDMIWRLGHHAQERENCVVFFFKIWRTIWAPRQLLRTQDGFQRSPRNQGSRRHFTWEYNGLTHFSPFPIGDFSRFLEGT